MGRRYIATYIPHSKILYYDYGNTLTGEAKLSAGDYPELLLEKLATALRNKVYLAR
jgi:hypothetical protein